MIRVTLGYPVLEVTTQGHRTMKEHEQLNNYKFNKLILNDEIYDVAGSIDIWQEKSNNFAPSYSEPICEISNIEIRNIKNEPLIKLISAKGEVFLAKWQRLDFDNNHLRLTGFSASLIM